MEVKSYEIRELIGEGSFGKVYKARVRSSDNLVAYKVICKTGRRLSEVQALRKECEILKNLQHPNIIRMLDSFETNEALVVITEFALKDLCQILKEEGVLSENRARRITKDLVSALHYLHSNRILHRDLKPPNVLLDSFGSAKLCDFGFAKVLGNDNSVLTSIKGTPLYMAPELMNESPYDHTADLWSLGCITYQLVTGRPPFTTSSILNLIKMLKLEPVKWPNHLSDSCLSFLKGLLQKNPICRLSWPYLQYHPFINFQSTSNTSGHSTGIDSHCPSQNVHISLIHSSPSSNSNGSLNYHRRKLQCLRKEKRSNDSKGVHHCSKKCETEPEDIESSVQKEEWLEFLRQTIHNVMLGGDVDVLIEKHSLKLIMNAFNTCYTCPVVVTTIARLLSLPFVAESVSENNTSMIKQAFAECEIMTDLLTVIKYITVEKLRDRKIDVCHEVALQQLLLLVRYLTFTDRTLLKKFFRACISLSFFNIIKNYLGIRTRSDPFSAVRYVIAIFLRLYVIIPESRLYIFTAFDDCINEFHSIFQESEDISVHMQLCTFITVLCCTQPNFLSKTEATKILINDLTKLKIYSNAPLTLQIDGTLEILKNKKQ